VDSPLEARAGARFRPEAAAETSAAASVKSTAASAVLPMAGSWSAASPASTMFASSARSGLQLRRAARNGFRSAAVSTDVWIY